MFPRRSRGLAFMACPQEDFARLSGQLQNLSPSTSWELVCFYPPSPSDVPPGASVTISRRSARLAAAVWFKAAVAGFDRAVVCCRDLGQPSALESLLGFVAILPVRTKVLVDRHGRRQSIPKASLGAALELVAALPLSWIAMLVTLAGLKTYRRDPARSTAVSDTTAILLPILPDLSHTFVYREALALKQRHPDYLMLSLESGDRSIVHPEAADLLRLTEFVPRMSAARYLWSYIAAWLRAPAAMAALIRYFQPHTPSFGAGAIADDKFCFLRLEHLHHSNYLMLGFALAEFLRKRRVGYVHVFGSTYPAVRMLVAHRLLGVPFSISTFVDFEYPTPFYMLDAKFRHARFVVACTEFCARRLTARLPDLQGKLRVLHHALPAGYPKPERLRTRDGRSRIVYVGRFVPKKGLDTLIHACRLLRDHRVGFSCHLYGAGVDEDSLRALVTALSLEDVVSFEGPIPNERFYEVMNLDDVFVCPSRYMADGERDGIPVTLLEAMAVGVTVVATPVSGIPELIVDGVNGYLVPPDDPQALASALQGLLDDPAKRAKVAEPAIRTIREQFSIENTIELLDRWITREIGSRVETPGPESHPAREHA